MIIHVEFLISYTGLLIHVEEKKEEKCVKRNSLLYIVCLKIQNPWKGSVKRNSLTLP